MPASLEGMNLHFHPNNLAAAWVRVQKTEFARARVDLSKAVDPLVNVSNNESILFDETDVGNRMIEGLALSRDHHALLHSGETTVDFA